MMARPAQFEREDVLEKAMEAFWEQGYCATSMARLVEVTDLRPGSLYAAFKSKEALFLAVLDHYTRQSIARLEHALAEADSPLQGIRNYFQTLARDATDAQSRRSCLLVNTVLELARQNDVIQIEVNRHLIAIEAIFTTALESARQKGEISADSHPADLAAFIMTSIWGLRVLSGTDATPERAQAVVRQLLVVLGK